MNCKTAWTLGALTALAVGPLAAYDDVPVVPLDTGDGVKGLEYARAFTVETPYVYTWTEEQAEITEGYILVFEVDPALAQPKAVESPVLYVGRRPAEVTNLGVESGRMVVLVPGDTDLATARAYFGSVQLPEQVDTARGAEEEAAAVALGIVPIGEAAVTAALAMGGEPLVADSIDGVYRAVADVIDTYSPAERELVDSYRLIPE